MTFLSVTALSWLVTALVTCAYGTALTINSLAGVGAVMTVSALIMLNSIGRICGVTGVLLLLASLRQRSGLAGSGRAPTLDWSACLPFIVAVTAQLGNLAFYVLVASGGGLSVWPAAVGLYSVVPVLYGIFVRKERVTLRSGAGVVLALAAVLLLGLSVSGLSGGAGSWYVQAPLFLVVIMSWGGCDVLSATITAPRVVVLVSTLFGHAMCTAAAGLAVLVTVTDAAAAASAPGAAPPPPSAPFGRAQAALIVGNAVALVGWLGYVYLGALPGARLSTFVPVISLYAFFPAIFGLAFLGEELTPLKAAGLCLGVAATLAMAAPSAPAVEPLPAAGDREAAAPSPTPAAAGGGGGGASLPTPLCIDTEASAAASTAVCISPVGPVAAVALSAREGDGSASAWRAVGAVHDDGGPEA